jgi:MYXO-CTERM domain-containing protein
MTFDDLRAVAQASFGAWNEITCPDGAMPRMEAHEGAELSQCDLTEYNVNGPNVSTIMFVQSGWDARRNDPTAYAVTTVWHSVAHGYIYDVDMELNDERFTFTRCGDMPCGGDDDHIDLQNVMTHEAGHWFGMAHSADTTSTMYFTAPPGEIAKRTLEADDIAGFCDAYGAYDPGSSCDDTPHGGLKLTCGDLACGPDGPNLPVTAGSLGAGAPVICRGGAACSVTHDDATGPFSFLVLSAMLGLVARRRSRV